MRRRRAIGIATASMLATSAWKSNGAFADELSKAKNLIQTSGMGEGPFYPDRMPLDTDNDLLIVNDSITPGVGEITHLSGQVLTKSGSPIRNAFVEIWQVDGNGVYLHSKSNGAGNRDSNFQGYGRFLTDSSGRYYFRTIKPVDYPGRTPHIHVAVSKNGHRILTTQLLVKGNAQNKQDGLFKRIKDPAARETVLVDFKPIEDSKIGELAANFPIVLGHTAFEDEQGQMRGVAPSNLQSRNKKRPS
ncbi:MAG: intradiol ring-cleavage dioxygenase [Rubripirellula sp.]